jgi:tetratricopeptide (TPR) repeat protein
MNAQDKAEKLFKKSLKWESNDEAIELLNEASSLDPSNPNIFAVRSIKLALQGRYHQAKEDLEKAIKLEPNNIFALEAKALIEIHKGNLKIALLSIDKFLGAVASVIDDWQKTGLRVMSVCFNLRQKYFDVNDLAYAFYLKATIHKNLEEYDLSLRSLAKAKEYDHSKKLEKSIAKITSIVQKRKEELVRLKFEEERRYKSTIQYKVRNIARTFIAFSFILLILAPRKLLTSNKALIVNCLATGLGFLIFICGLMSPNSDEGLAFIGIGLLITIGCIFFILIGFFLENIWEGILDGFNSFSQKLTGLSIYEIIESSIFL